MRKVASLFLAASLVCCGANLLPLRLPVLKFSSDLLKGSPNTANGNYRVIIQWSSASVASSQKISGLGGTVLREFRIVKAGTYVIPALALNSLMNDPDVKYISVDRAVHRKLATVAATIGAPAVWKAGFNGSGVGVAVIDSGINPDSNLGTIAYSEDFTDQTSDTKKSQGLLGSVVATVAGQQNVGADWYGHGQHIAGIITSNGSASKCLGCTSTFTGIASGAKLINLKVLDGMGEGNESDVIAAVERAIDLKSKFNIRVINMSLGRPVFESYTSDPLCQAVEAAWKAGIVVVVSAGNEGRDDSFDNDGYGTILSPGNDPYVITVGAMKTQNTPMIADDTIASYSSKGPSAVDHFVKPDILAPGNQIVSLRAKSSRLPLVDPENITPLSAYQTYRGFVNPAKQPGAPSDASKRPDDARIGLGFSFTYFSLSGTSMAAAVVSGAVADLVQANPSLTPDQVKMLLMKTASKSFPESSSVTDADTGVTFTSYYDLFTVGAGYMNLSAALAEVTNMPTGVTALSPVATFDDSTNSVSLVFDSSSVFSDRAKWGADSPYANRAKWGASAVWSESVLSGERAMWGARAKWGASSMDAQRAMWGASSIWGERAKWGASSASSQSDEIIAKGEK